MSGAALAARWFLRAFQCSLVEKSGRKEISLAGFGGARMHGAILCDTEKIRANNSRVVPPRGKTRPCATRFRCVEALF